jgi:hypothetical protein
MGDNDSNCYDEAAVCVVANADARDDDDDDDACARGTDAADAAQTEDITFGANGTYYATLYFKILFHTLYIG